MESANIPAVSENLDTMNLTNNQDAIKNLATNEQTIEVMCIFKHRMYLFFHDLDFDA